LPLISLRNFEIDKPVAAFSQRDFKSGEREVPR
jgi:hypothetical protein